MRHARPIGLCAGSVREPHRSHVIFYPWIAYQWYSGDIRHAGFRADYARGFRRTCATSGHDDNVSDLPPNERGKAMGVLV